MLLAVSIWAASCANSAAPGGDTGNGGDQGMPTGAAGAGPTGAAGTTASGTAGSSQPGGTTGTGGQSPVGSGGTTGVAGTTGSAGTTGPTGSAGTTGAAGRAGTTGSAGTTGAAGAQGTAGATGSCAGTLTRCGSVCVDTTGSQTNCGMCGKTCRPEQTCWQSACRCPTGQDDCDGVCKDVTSSTVNCGMCGKTCATGATCMAGQCVCPTNQTDCDGACTNLATDGRNCGQCRTVCGAGTMCLFGACLDPNTLVCSPSARANQSSTRDASITLGKYWVNNNWWGASSATGSQSIWSTCQQGDLIGWGTSWNWSGAANQVKTFASTVLGWQWGWKVTNTGLPLQISSGRRLTCGWDFTFSHTGGAANVAYDIWLHSLPMAGTNDDPTDEVMIWLYRANGAGPIGTRQTTVTLASASWDLYRGQITDSSGRVRWNVFSFVRTANATTAIMNIMDFMNDLVTRGWVQSSKYVSSVQAGTEIFTGMGQLDTRGYYCRVQ